MDTDKTLDAIWCCDSETGDWVLVDRQTNQIIARKNNRDEWRKPDEHS